MVKLKSTYRIKTGTNELIYLFLWFVFSFSYVLNTSLIGKSISVFNAFFKLELVAFTCFLTIMFFLHGKIKVKKILLFSLIFLCSLMIIKITGNKVYITCVLFILNSNFTSFKKVTKVSIVSLLLSTLMVVALCKVGLIEDYIFLRDEGIQAHSLGFAYYYNISANFLFISILYMYYKENVKWIELLSIIGIAYIIFKLCTTRLPFIVTVFAVVLYIIFYKKNLVKNINKRIVRVYSLVAFPIVFLICVIAAVKYNPDNKYFYMMNKILNHRLSLSRRAFDLYDVKIFGQFVEMKGNTYGETNINYFFIDSGYILGIIQYGIIATILLLAVYCIFYYYSTVTNNKKLFIWITIILVYNIVNGCWLAFVTNPLFFLIMYMDRYHLTELLRAMKKNKQYNWLIERLKIKEGI